MTTVYSPRPPGSFGESGFSPYVDGEDASASASTASFRRSNAYTRQHQTTPDNRTGALFERSHTD
jgi:hypothetical protein